MQRPLIFRVDGRPVAGTSSSCRWDTHPSIHPPGTFRGPDMLVSGEDRILPGGRTLIARDCATHACDCGPPSSPRQQEGACGPVCRLRLVRSDRRGSWEYRWCRHEPRGPGSSWRGERVLPLGGGARGRNLCGIDEVNFPPAAGSWSPTELGGRGWVCWCEGRVRGEGVGIYAQLSRGEAVLFLVCRGGQATVVVESLWPGRRMI